MNFFKNFLKGICIGAGAILPGISSGVLCVIFGIYDKLVDSVLSIFHEFKKNFLFLLPIVLGCFVGVFLLGNILNFLFTTYEMQTKYAFIGLILGSVPLLVQKINSENTFHMRYLLFTIFSFGVGILAVLLESYISNLSESTGYVNTLFSNFTPSFIPMILLTIIGFFMSLGIVVPGVSSTLILMCFGIYPIYLSAVSEMNLSILVPLAIGVIIGGIIFLKMIDYLLKHYYMQSFYTIIGFTLGSVFVLYMPISFDFTGFISIILLIVCFYITSLLEKNG